MGYCYQGKRLVCDGCGTTEGVRKRPCPFGYCPAPAFCPACHERHAWGKKATHQAHGCDVRHARYVAELAERDRFLAEGYTIRRCAVGIGDGPTAEVQVCFADKAGRETICYMDHATYDAIPLGTHATIAMFQTHGTVRAEPRGPIPAYATWPTATKRAA